MLQSLANQIIQQIEDDYDTIAGHFSNTRHEAWPEFELLRTLIGTENTATVSLLDVGCGNGRLAASLPAVHYTGLDLSRQLLQIAQQRFSQYRFIHGSILQLPFTDAEFDVVACVAALQHIPSVAYRQQAIQEIARVLKSGGIVFMLNWNLNEQLNYQTYRADPSTGYDADDYLIPWKNDQGELQANRYYHGFRSTELTQLAENAELEIVKNELGKDQRNILTIARKV